MSSEDVIRARKIALRDEQVCFSCANAPVAVEKCADDTKGQTCFICTQALHWKTKEGLVRGCSCRGTAGFVHVSCLAEQAKILVAEAEENNLAFEDFFERFERWHKCGLCEQRHHGVAGCALGWACWKTYLGRPETDMPRQLAVNELSNGLMLANYLEDALSIQEIELSMMRRLGKAEGSLLAVRSNIATTYAKVGRLEQALQLRKDVYSDYVKKFGEEQILSLKEAINYASTLNALGQFKEAKQLLKKTTPMARRVVGESHELTLAMRSIYAKALYKDTGATLDDLREAVDTLEDSERIARRVLGSTHPLVQTTVRDMRDARALI